MDRTTRTRFKDLLVDLPFWPEQRQRSAFVTDIFWNHEIKSRFNPDGSGDLVAGELLDLCNGFDAPTESGESPLCALLTGVRENNLAAGARAAVVTDLSRRLGCTSRKPAWSHDPYPGLAAFQHWQAPVFFGRAVETRDLLRRLETDQGRRFLLVTGASGSGKSSLVRAGVWPALVRGDAPNLSGSADWLITAMFPADQKEQDGNADPFHALTNSLKQHPLLGWLYPGEEADKLKSNPAAFADLLARALADLPAGAEWLLRCRPWSAKRGPGVRGRRRRVRVTAVAKGLKVPVAVHAISMPAAARAVIRFPSDSSWNAVSLQFWRHLLAFDTSTMIRLRSSPLSIPDAIKSRLFLDAHHNGSLPMQLKVV